MTSDISILARMAKRQEAPVVDVPLTSSRALRVAMTRAADKSLGLSLTVSSVSETPLALDHLIQELPPENMYIALTRHGITVGILGIDAQIRAAAIEMQTMGKLSSQSPKERPHTKTDLMLIMPFCLSLMEELLETTSGSELEGWADDIVLGAAFESPRAAGLVLEDAEFRVMKLSIDLSVGERQAEVLLALPNNQQAVKAEVVSPLDQSWGAKMYSSVSAAPTTLTAVLHKMSLPLGQVDALKVGQVLPLYGATVGSVQLFAPDGVFVTEARLGQSGGKRAVRIEAAQDLAMRDLPAPKARAAAEVD